MVIYILIINRKSPNNNHLFQTYSLPKALKSPINPYRHSKETKEKQVHLKIIFNTKKQFNLRISFLINKKFIS